MRNVQKANQRQTYYKINSKVSMRSNALGSTETVVELYLTAVQHLDIHVNILTMQTIGAIQLSPWLSLDFPAHVDLQQNK